MESLTPGLVTIAIPTFNGSRFLREALDSARQQTYRHFELLIVDDGSTDDSVSIVERFLREYPEISGRVIRNASRLGLAQNWNRCVELAKGQYLKFLFQDDALEPECLTEFVKALEETPSAGVAFAPRKILVEGRRDFTTRLWIHRHGAVHTRFARLDSVNDGAHMFREQMHRDPFLNWIGEPTVVMLRTEVVRQSGGFNPRMKQLTDVEMWLRLMGRTAFTFVERPLASFRLHGSSTTFRNVRSGKAWLDPLWLVEGLLADPGMHAYRLSAGRLRTRAALRVMRMEFMRLIRGRMPVIFSRLEDLQAWRRYVTSI